MTLNDTVLANYVTPPPAIGGLGQTAAPNLSVASIRASLSSFLPQSVIDALGGPNAIQITPMSIDGKRVFSINPPSVPLPESEYSNFEIRLSEKTDANGQIVLVVESNLRPDTVPAFAEGIAQYAQSNGYALIEGEVSSVTGQSVMRATPGEIISAVEASYQAHPASQPVVYNPIIAQPITSGAQVPSAQTQYTIDAQTPIQNFDLQPGQTITVRDDLYAHDYTIQTVISEGKPYVFMTVDGSTGGVIPQGTPMGLGSLFVQWHGDRMTLVHQSLMPPIAATTNSGLGSGPIAVTQMVLSTDPDVSDAIISGAVEVKYGNYTYSLVNDGENVTIYCGSPSGEMIELGSLGGENGRVGPFLAMSDGIYFFPFQITESGINIYAPTFQSAATTPPSTPDDLRMEIPGQQHWDGAYSELTYFGINQHAVKQGGTASWIRVSVDLGNQQSEEFTQYALHQAYNRLKEICRQQGIFSPVIVVEGNTLAVAVPKEFTMEMSNTLLSAVDNSSLAQGMISTSVDGTETAVDLGTLVTVEMVSLNANSDPESLSSLAPASTPSIHSNPLIEFPVENPYGYEIDAEMIFSMHDAWQIAERFNINPQKIVVADGYYTIVLSDGQALDRLQIEKIKVAWEQALQLGLEPASIEIHPDSFILLGANGEALDIQEISFAQNGGLPPEQVASRTSSQLRAMAEADLKAFNPQLFRAGNAPIDIRDISTPQELMDVLMSGRTVVLYRGVSRASYEPGHVYATVPETVMDRRMARPSDAAFEAYRQASNPNLPSRINGVFLATTPDAASFYSDRVNRMEISLSPEVIAGIESGEITALPVGWYDYGSYATAADYADADGNIPEDVMARYFRGPRPGQTSEVVVDPSLVTVRAAGEYAAPVFNFLPAEEATPAAAAQDDSPIIENPANREIGADMLRNIHDDWNMAKEHGMKPLKVIIANGSYQFELADGRVVDSAELNEIIVNAGVVFNLAGLPPAAPISMVELPEAVEEALADIRAIDPQIADLIETQLRSLTPEQLAALDITKLNAFVRLLDRGIVRGRLGMNNYGTREAQTSEMLLGLGMIEENVNTILAEMRWMRLESAYGRKVVAMLKEKGVDIMQGDFVELFRGVRNSDYLADTLGFTSDQVADITEIVALRNQAYVAQLTGRLDNIEQGLTLGELSAADCAQQIDFVNTMIQRVNEGSLEVEGGIERLNDIKARLEARVSSEEAIAQADPVGYQINLARSQALLGTIALGRQLGVSDGVLADIYGRGPEAVEELARMSEQELLERYSELNSDQAHKMVETARTFEDAAASYRYDQATTEAVSMGTGFITAELMTALCQRLGFNKVESLITVLTSMHVVSTGTSLLLSNPNISLTELLDGTVSPTSLMGMIRGLGPATLYIGGFNELMSLITGQDWGDNIGERAISFWVGGSLLPKIANSLGSRVFASVAARVAEGTLAKGWLKALSLAGDAFNLAGWVLFALQAKGMAEDFALMMASNDPNFQSNMRDGWALNVYRHRNDPDAANYWPMPDISNTEVAKGLIDLVDAASGEEIIEAQLYVDSQIEAAGAGAREQLTSILQMKMFEFAQQILSQNPNITIQELDTQVGAKMQEYIGSLDQPVAFSETEQGFVDRIQQGLEAGKSPADILADLNAYQQSGAYQFIAGIPGLQSAPTLSENEMKELLNKVLLQKAQQLWQQIGALRPRFGQNAAYQNHDLFTPETGAQIPLTPIMDGLTPSLYDVFMQGTGFGMIQNLFTGISQNRMQTLLGLATYQNGEWVLPSQPLYITETGQILPQGSLLSDNGDGTYSTFTESSQVTVYRITVGNQQDIDLGLVIRKDDGTLVVNQENPAFATIMGSIANKFLITQAPNS